MDWNKLTDDERLVAEQAIATYRAVKLAGDQAPHGRGLYHLEQAVREHGDELLRATLQRAINGRDEAQKKGSRRDGTAPRAGARRSSSASRPSAC
jgi:hypothetical protein